MTNYKCEKCGNEGSVSEGNSLLQYGKVKNWEEGLSEEWIKVLKTPFNKVSGVTDKGESFRTLFLSTIVRNSILDAMREEEDNNISQKWKDTVAPVLSKLEEIGVKSIGALAPPSHLALAVTDLQHPVAVFTFVTVLDEPFLLEKLRSNGLINLIDEGSANTIGGPNWLEVANSSY